MFRQLFRMRMLNPLRVRGFILFLPHFTRLFYRLMNDGRVPIIAKLVPLFGLLLMLTPPALELDFVPLIGELDWLLVGYITLKIFLWLCPPEVVREHVGRIAQGA
jgi:hypothetical protein